MDSKNRPKKKWSTDDSKDLYAINEWGCGYFDISDGGDVVVKPDASKNSHIVSLKDIISGLREREITMPVLLRFSDILNSRIKILHGSFMKVIKETQYKNTYKGVFPIKVNQQQQVLEDITNFGVNYHHGLEVGSKAELIAAIPFLKDPDAYLICNGYKDEEFVDIALSAKKIGTNCIIVIETPSELPLIIRRAEKLKVRPVLGVRVKLSARAEGRWAESGGDKSAFGLNIAQIIGTIEQLKQKNMLECLKLLHYHIGSQISNIRDIRTGVIEACRVYAGMIKEGASLGILDLGGGLAVDYDGSNTDISTSSNYSINEYCADIIEIIISILDEEKIPHPVIVTESGRSTMAYSSMLLFNILDTSRFKTENVPESVPEDYHEMIHNIKEISKSLSRKNVQECYNDAIYYRDEILQLFKHGVISLRERTIGEQIYWGLIISIADEIKKMENVPPDLAGVENLVADIYYCNFSVFQSLPDAWAIGQTFPVLPVHRLHEEPTRNAILADITCDCDGKIDKFINRDGNKNLLPLHTIKPDEEYYLGVFLVGAYQETLGDLHNLLGDTNIVSIRVGPSGEIVYSNEIEGDTVADVLTYVEYDPKALMARVREMAESAVQEGKITLKERRAVIKVYSSGLRGYTYFER